MSWTYTGDPASKNLDAVRFLVGQTSTSDDVLIYDEEVSYLIAQFGTVNFAAAAAAESLAAQYRQRAPEAETYGQTSLQWGDRAKKLDELAKNLRRRGMVLGVSPFIGGGSVADMDSRKADTDRPKERFTLGRFDDPGIVDSTGST